MNLQVTSLHLIFCGGAKDLYADGPLFMTLPLIVF